MSNIKQLEENIKNLILADYNKEDYLMLEKFIDYILIKKQNNKPSEFRVFYSKTKILKLCENFMESIGFLNYYNLIKDNIYLIDNIHDKSKIMKLKIKETGCYRINNKKIIIIFLENNIKDLYKLIHEIIHSYNMKDKPSIVWYELTETLSFLGEQLLTDFIKQEKIEYNCDLFKKYRLSFAETLSYILSLELNEIENYLNTGTLSKQVLDKNSICNRFNKYSNLFKKLNIKTNPQYIYAIIFSSYLYERKLKTKSLEEFKFLNDSLNDLTFKEFLNNIDLDLKNMQICDLKEESYKKLYKSYDKYYRS